MRNFCFLTFALLLQFCFAAPQGRPNSETDASLTLPRRQTQKYPPNCPRRGVHLIVGSGAGCPQVRGYGLLSTTVNAIMQLVPGTNNYSVPYQKTSDPSQINAAVIQGADLMTQNIAWYAAGCPNTPIVLLGYSEGAMVVTDTLCGRSRRDGQPYGTPLNSTYAPNIIASVLYGSEERIPNQPWDLGTCTSGSGYFPQANPQGCAAFAANMRSYCDVNDPACCSGSPSPNMTNHYVYPGEYDSQVAQFVKSQYDAWKAARKTR